MLTEFIRNFYAYSAWANQRILKTADGLTAAQFVSEPEVNMPGLRDLLVHIMSAERVWGARFRQVKPPPVLRGQDFPDQASVRALWSTVAAETQSFVASVDDRTLGLPAPHVNSKGEHYTYPLWQIMLHQANHAMQHRSEAALLLTRLGFSPGGLDYLVYVDQSKSTAS